MRVRIAFTVVSLAFVACVGTDYASTMPGGSSSSGDAGPDVAATSSDAGDEVSTFCAAHADAAYCEDFDDAKTDVSALDPESNPPELLPVLTRETFRSPPRSLVMAIPKGQPEGTYLVFKRSFDGTKTIRVELDWNFAIGPEVPGTLQAITLKRAAPQVAFGRACVPADDGGTQCSWYVGRCVTSFSPCDDIITYPSPPFVGKFARVFIEARLEKAGHLAFGVVGSAPIYDADVVGATDDVVPADPTTVTIGLANLQGESPGLSMFVDSIVVHEK